MSTIAEVLEFTRSVDSNGFNVSEAKCDLGGGNIVTAVHYSPPGDDAHPLAGDFAILVEGGGQGNWIAVGFIDPQLAPSAGPGEKIVYSRSAPGVIASKIHLKADGSVVINDAVTITSSGAVQANGEVTAMAAAVPVSLSTHQHPTGVGPSGPPTPGT